MFLFSSCLNRVQRISLAGYRLMEMSSSESPYFLSKLGGNKEECQTTSSKSDSYQKVELAPQEAAKEFKVPIKSNRMKSLSPVARKRGKLGKWWQFQKIVRKWNGRLKTGNPLLIIFERWGSIEMLQLISWVLNNVQMKPQHQRWN